MGGSTVRFVEDAPGAVGLHHQPVWKLALSFGGPLTVRGADGRLRSAAGFLAPPGVLHQAGSTDGHVAVFIDPWHAGLGAGSDVVAVDEVSAAALLDRVLATPAGGLDDAVADGLALLRRRDVVAATVTPDPRVVAALGAIRAGCSLAEAAAGVGLSPTRLRALSGEAFGVPPVAFRAWSRLQSAVSALGHLPPADAAAVAGFADQAHLTRTARRLLGRTPGSVAPALRASRPGATVDAG